MLRIGLTGGIGSGKSAAANLFARLGVPVIDADILAREAVSKGSPALHRIVETFGTRILTPTGDLDRRAMRGIVFDDRAARKTLEAIIHPEVRRSIEERTASLAGSDYCIVVVPLLLETGMGPVFDRVLVVDCDEGLQLSRATARDGVTERDVRAIMASQIARSERLEGADDIIDNSGDLDHLCEQVERLHRAYSREASGNVRA